MAKDKKKKYDSSNSNEEQKLDLKNKIVTVILSMLFVIILFGALIIFIKLDIGGFGSKVMRPIFKNVKVINKVLPDVDDDVLISENEYPYENITEAVERITELQNELDKLKTDYDDISSEVEEKDAEITRLQQFEKTQDEFDAQVEKFNEDIVFNDNAPDISEYIAYYEQIEPENAEKIYKQAVLANASNDKVTEIANTYAKMDPKTAAQALEEMKDSMSLVCDILNTMSQKNRAAIMDEMSSSFVALVTKKLGND